MLDTQIVEFYCETTNKTISVQQVKICYPKLDNKFDEWIAIDDPRLKVQGQLCAAIVRETGNSLAIRWINIERRERINELKKVLHYYKDPSEPPKDEDLYVELEKLSGPKRKTEIERLQKELKGLLRAEEVPDDNDYSVQAAENVLCANDTVEPPPEYFTLGWESTVIKEVHDDGTCVVEVTFADAAAVETRRLTLATATADTRKFLKNWDASRYPLRKIIE